MISALHSPAFDSKSPLALLARRVATAGFVLYAAFAPHSIAGAEIALAIVGLGWLVRTIATGKAGFRRTKLDLPIWLFFAWTIASSCLSQEPQISVAKLQSVCVLFLFYLTQAIVTRGNAVFLVCIMILSGVAGSIYSVYDLLRGRGIVAEAVSGESPLRMSVAPGDVVWRVDGRRIYSVDEIERAIKAVPSGTNLRVSVITRGEHVERTSLAITDQLKQLDAPSGIMGGSPTHRFRASGWTRHYETFSEILQILAQLTLGLGLANLKNHGANLRFKLAAAASALLALGIALTAMRTVLVALTAGACVLTIRVARGKARFLVPAALVLVLALGAFIVWQTRAEQALWFRDDSASLRLTVAYVGVSRIMLHPIFGHGMDAMHLHWNEWGFPGQEMLGLHSTPLQLAFDRGIPALALWLWVMAAFWLMTTRAERILRDSPKKNQHGLLLGATGAIAGFFASSLVNYNFGDGEVALVFWWLMGIVVVLARDNTAARFVSAVEISKGR
ncbi:MAG: O-antigen ligase family protein [Pyrinomonadaceae bacterium]|nr:O-antigen ligase family protein [Pyrinomonadaceae bacterium]